MAGLTVERTAIPGLLIVRMPVHGDSRGWFKENWQRAKMTELGLPDFGPVQNNISFNASRGATRGIHAEPWDKYVSVATGRVFGAWVDLREGESFGATVTVEVDESVAVFVPRGVGNSYQALEDGTADVANIFSTNPVISEKGWVRTLKGHVEDLSGLAFKTDDKLEHSFFAETTSKLLLFATNGKFYSLDVAKLPGGRGHGEPIRMFIDLEQDAAIISLFVNKGERKFLIASSEGQGFVVKEEDCVGNTRKGKQVLNVEMPNEARAITTVLGDTVAVIGTNHKMVLFGLDQVPEMARGRGVRLQKYTSSELSDVAVFDAKTEIGRAHV